MYRYYQTGEHSSWTPIADSLDVYSDAKKANAKKLTILAVSEVINDDTTDLQSLTYKGPLYFDIDCKDDLNQAILSTRTLVRRLQDLNVPDEAIEVVASGGKGLHVMVPQSVFSSGRPLQQLPKVYLEMAKELHVVGLDFQVYNMGRGTCWRLLNVRREKDGKYPVRLTLAELADLTVEQYQEYVSGPRPVPVYDLSHAKAPGLSTLFERCKKIVRERPLPAAMVVPSDQLIPVREIPPACIQELAEYHVKGDKNFNEVAMQFAAFVARSGMEEKVWEPLVSRVAESTQRS